MFAERYEILRELGSGSTGRVYLARDKKLNKLWAVKEIRPDESADSLKRESAGAELFFLRELSHEGLPRIVDIYQEQNRILLVMDYIEGVDLESLSRQRKGLDPDEVIRIGIRICECLDYLHSRQEPVIYRDLKPSNMIMTSSGAVKLVDLGGCIRQKDAGRSGAIGSRRYAAPELYRRQALHESDIYSLGKTLEALLDPEDGDKSRRGQGKRRKVLYAFIGRCTQKDPVDRYKSAADAGAALRRLKKRRPRLYPAALIIGIVAVIRSVSWGSDAVQGNEAGPWDAQGTEQQEGAGSEGGYEGQGYGQGNHDWATNGSHDPGQKGYALGQEGDISGQAGADAKKELLRIRELVDKSAGLWSGEDAKEEAEEEAVRLLEEAGRMMDALEMKNREMHFLKEDEVLELNNCRMEELSMLSAIYRMLGRKDLGRKREMYSRAADCIKALFEVKGFRESPMYRVKLSDLVSIKDELGESEEALGYLRDWEKGNPDPGKELYFAHALILLKNEGNKKELGELYSRMKLSGEVKSDFRYRDMARRIEDYLSRK